MKIVKTEIIDGVDEYRTQPEGRFWIQVDRRHPTWIYTLRTVGQYAPNSEVAEFNSFFLASNYGLEQTILLSLNSAEDKGVDPA